MLRPASIVTFERCYLGAWAIGLINTIVNWQTTMAAMSANPNAAALGPSFATTMMIGGLVIGAAITVLLWYFVAKRGSLVAKWVVTILIALGVIFFVFGAAMGRMQMGPVAIVGIMQVVLQVVAVVMLFRPDTKAWFGEDRPEPVA